ncbi:MAG: monovalent cation/H(+) antiporter subunit G [Candidatus Competibacteraceae bacterium]
MLDVIVVLLLVGGLLLFAGATIGLLRFPDFYCRVHAAGKGDTLSTMLLLGGLILYQLHDFSGASVLVGLKLFLIILFVFVSSPVAAHAIIDAGYEARAPYWVKPAPPELATADADAASPSPKP